MSGLVKAVSVLSERHSAFYKVWKELNVKGVSLLSTVIITEYAKIGLTVLVKKEELLLSAWWFEVLSAALASVTSFVLSPCVTFLMLVP